jgi:hypothetical protein
LSLGHWITLLSNSLNFNFLLFTFVISSCR